jgi:hypothetical protein
MAFGFATRRLCWRGLPGVASSFASRSVSVAHVRLDGFRGRFIQPAPTFSDPNALLPRLWHRRIGVITDQPCPVEAYISLKKTLFPLFFVKIFLGSTLLIATHRLIHARRISTLAATRVKSVWRAG